MQSTVPIRLSSSGETLMERLGTIRLWCEAVIGCPLADALLCGVDVDLGELAALKLLEGISLESTPHKPENADQDPDESFAGFGSRFIPLGLSRFTAAAFAAWPGKILGRLARWELPPEVLPGVELSPSRVRTAPVTEPGTAWAVTWKEGPVALWFEGLEHALLALKVPAMTSGCRAEETMDTHVLVNRRELPAALALLRPLFEAGPPVLRVLGGMNVRLAVTRHGWTDFILSEELTGAVKEDFELFLSQERWYRRHRLPYRRGYLFHGTPGNGKTSVVRVMASYPEVTPYGIDFSNEDLTNQWLTHLIVEAERSAPSLIVLEDLDRLYGPRRREYWDNRSGITMQHLLNCLDGLGRRDGVIFVATANDIRGLEPAVLERPGRFDVVAEFANPGEPLRRRFFQTLGMEVDEGQLDAAARLTDGFSFAQLREVHIVAARRAFRRRSDTLAWPDLWEAIECVMAALQSVRSRTGGRAPGFEARPRRARNGQQSGFVSRTQGGQEEWQSDRIRDP